MGSRLCCSLGRELVSCSALAAPLRWIGPGFRPCGYWGSGSQPGNVAVVSPISQQDGHTGFLSTPPSGVSSQPGSPSVPYIYLTLMRRIDWNDGICKGRGVKVHKTSLSGAAISGPMGLVGEIKGLAPRDWSELTAITFQMCAQL